MSRPTCFLDRGVDRDKLDKHDKHAGRGRPSAREPVPPIRAPVLPRHHHQLKGAEPKPLQCNTCTSSASTSAKVGRFRQRAVHVASSSIDAEHGFARQGCVWSFSMDMTWHSDARWVPPG
jgi:hypothetical protein